MDLSDDKETCIARFGLVNVIVDDRISQPKWIKELFGKLRDEAIDQKGSALVAPAHDRESLTIIGSGHGFRQEGWRWYGR